MVHFNEGDPRISDTQYINSNGLVVRDVVLFADGSMSDDAREYDVAGNLAHTFATVKGVDGATSTIDVRSNGTTYSSTVTNFGSGGQAIRLRQFVSDELGTRESISTSTHNDGVLDRTETDWDGGGTVLENALPTGGVSRTVTAVIGGESVTATYTVDAKGKEILTSIDLIDGVVPTDPSAVAAALVALGVGSTELARMADGSSALAGSDAVILSSARRSVASTLAAFDETNSTGILDSASGLTGIGNLIGAIKGKNPAGIALSDSDLSALASRGFNSSFVPSNIQASSGTTDRPDLLSNFSNSFLSSLNRGDLGSSLLSGLAKSHLAIGIARGIAKVQLDSLTDQLANLTGLEDVTDLLNVDLGQFTDVELSDLLGGADLEDVLGLVSEIDDVGEILDALADVGGEIRIFTDVIGAVRAFESGDILGGILEIANIIALVIPELAPFIFAAEAIIGFVQSIFGGGGAPIRWQVGGMAHLAVDGHGGVVSVMDNNYAGGGQVAQSALQAYANVVNGLVQTLRNNGFADAALIPERLSPVRDGYGVQLEYNDHGQWSLFDYAPDGTREWVNFTGAGGPSQRAQPLDPTDPNFFRQDFGSTFLRNVLANAIGPQWEADTARLEVQNGTGYHGQSALVHARQTGHMAAAPGATETVKLITLDLAGTGSIPVATQAGGGGVMFDVNGSGFANAMDWVGPRVGVLGVDLGENGALDSGVDLFNDMRLDGTVRGLAALQEYDVLGTGALTAADPIFSHLQVWTDTNQDGVQQANEVQSLASLGLTQLDFTHGTFTQNGTTRLLADTELTADSQGVITQSIFDQRSSTRLKAMAVVEEQRLLVVDQELVEG